MNTTTLQSLIKLIRYNILASSTAAGSGHPTSSLSAADLMGVLFFGGFFRYDIKHPENIHNDRLIFSKGHASPLFYSLWAAVKGSGITNEELLNLRKITSRLEGHPTRLFPYTEVATGSLGQGLSIGVGMALNAKYDSLNYKTYVLLGDSEMAEGSNWEAMQSAAHYKLDNLVGIIDVNRLGQRGETMPGHDVKDFERKAKAFGWDTAVIDGHNIAQIAKAFAKADKSSQKPFMIIAKTLKGKGVSFLADQDGWHGKALKPEDLQKAVGELGKVEMNIRGTLKIPNVKAQNLRPRRTSLGLAKKFQISLAASRVRGQANFKFQNYSSQTLVATRKAYGDAIAALAQRNKQVVVLDAETSNSTYAETVKEKTPKQFFEMFIAEQNMVGASTGLARRGKIVFCSTFAAFFTRAADQIRMAQYSRTPVKFVGSHAGVSIGEDGASQMALEDLSLFRAIHGSVVLYPSDAVCAQACVELAAQTESLVYIRTTRANTPVLYANKTKFTVGGSHVLKQSAKDVVTVFAAGITLHEALKAWAELAKAKINIRVVDMYSVKPIDRAVIKKACQQTKALVVVEDHHPEGGLYEAICGSGAVTKPVYSLAVTKMPHSGKPEELLAYEGIDAAAIISSVRKVIKLKSL